MVIIQMPGLGRDKNAYDFQCMVDTYTYALIYRDNVYSIYCVFGLALAYRRVDDTTGRACKCFDQYP